MNLLPCPNNKDGHCAKSNPVILKMTDSFCTFRCTTCNGIYVETFSKYEEKAKYENRMKKYNQIAEQQKAQEKRVRYFT